MVDPLLNIMLKILRNIIGIERIVSCNRPKKKSFLLFSNPIKNLKK